MTTTTKQAEIVDRRLAYVSLLAGIVAAVFGFSSTPQAVSLPVTVSMAAVAGSMLLAIRYRLARRISVLAKAELEQEENDLD